jgi:hypothetical protein
MSVGELYAELTALIAKEPHRINQQIYVYIPDVTDLVDDGESPQPIVKFDSSISDRIDLNL